MHDTGQCLVCLGALLCFCGAGFFMLQMFILDVYMIYQKIITLVVYMLLFAFVSSGQKLRIMSYNIHIGQDAQNKDQLTAMADFMQASGATLIGLQEVDSVCNRSGKIDQLEKLKKQTGMYGVFSRHFAFDGGAYGLAVLSKYPIDSVRHERISLNSMGKNETRVLLVVFVTVNKRPLAFATVHLDYRDGASRRQQAQELIEKFDSYRMPVILTGDMNAEPRTDAITVLKKRFQDCTNDQALTYDAEKPTKKIDYVFVQQSAIKKVLKAAVIHEPFSDHLPVMATIRLK